MKALLTQRRDHAGHGSPIPGGAPYPASPKTEPEEEPWLSEALRILEKQQADLSGIRLDLEVEPLKRDLRRALPFLAVEDKKAVSVLLAVLIESPRTVSPTLIATARRFVEPYRRLFPPERRSMEFQAETRVSPGARIVRFRANDRSLDRHGTRVEPSGADTANYEKNPIFLWAHDGYGGLFTKPGMDSVIGKTVRIHKSREALDIDVRFATERENPNAEKAYRLVKGGFLNGVSIGFIPRKVVIETEDEREVPVVKEWELLEVSLVSIPSNPAALKKAREREPALG